jgi:ribosomal protein S18 acetylase RimI-like enzyme
VSGAKIAYEDELYLRMRTDFELYEGMRLVFETATEEDATELAELRNNAANKLSETFGKGPWSSGCTEKGVLYGMRMSRMVVARENGKIAGTLSLHTKKPWAIDPAYFTKVKKPLYLTSMFVAVERQHIGVGRLLLEQAVEIARVWPVDAIRLDAYDAAAGAGDFYARCGFREVGRAKYKGVALRYFERVINHG